MSKKYGMKGMKNKGKPKLQQKSAEPVDKGDSVAFGKFGGGRKAKAAREKRLAKEPM